MYGEKERRRGSAWEGGDHKAGLEREAGAGRGALLAQH